MIQQLNQLEIELKSEKIKEEIQCKRILKCKKKRKTFSNGKIINKWINKKVNGIEISKDIMTLMMMMMMRKECYGIEFWNWNEDNQIWNEWM